MAPTLRSLRDTRTVLLTTFRRDGTGVPTPVSIVVDGDRAFVRSYASSGKAKRLRTNPAATVTPCTLRGRPTGAALDARVRVADTGSGEHAARLLARKHPILHGVAVPLVHRLTGKQTIYLELTPVTRGVDDRLAP